MKSKGIGWKATILYRVYPVLITLISIAAATILGVAVARRVASDFLGLWYWLLAVVAFCGVGGLTFTILWGLLILAMYFFPDLSEENSADSGGST